MHNYICSRVTWKSGSVILLHSLLPLQALPATHLNLNDPALLGSEVPRSKPTLQKIVILSNRKAKTMYTWKIQNEELNWLHKLQNLQGVDKKSLKLHSISIKVFNPF